MKLTQWRAPRPMKGIGYLWHGKQLVFVIIYDNDSSLHKNAAVSSPMESKALWRASISEMWRCRLECRSGDGQNIRQILCFLGLYQKFGAYLGPKSGSPLENHYLGQPMCPQQLRSSLMHKTHCKIDRSCTN